MRVRRGDAVLVNYPFASSPGGKIRPALVVQCDRNNGRLDNTSIVPITSRTRFAHSETTQVLVQASTSAGKQAGLIADSAISCENIYTVRSDTIIRKTGRVPSDVMRQVNESLRASLDLT